MIEQVQELLPPWSLVGAVASLGGTAALTAVVVRRRSRTHELEAVQTPEGGQEGDAGGQRRRKLSAGTLAAAVAFVVCTSVSLNTSYRFTFDGLGMTGTAERVLSCAAFEALIAMCVLGARERLASKDATPGWYGTAVWAFAALSSVPAWHEGGGLTAGTVVRIIVGSFGSALSAHAALGLELKHRTGGQSQSPGALIMREIRERIMARLGLIERGRDAEQISRDRFLDRAIELADQHDRMTEKERGTKKGRRLNRRMGQAMDRGGYSSDPKQKAKFDRSLSMRRETKRLHETELPSVLTAQPTRAEQAALAQLAQRVEGMEALAAQIEGESAHAAAQTGTPVGTLPAQPGTDVCDEDEHQDEEDQDEPEALDLTRYSTKRAKLKAVFDRAKISADDPRNHNQIATELLKELAAHGVEYDRAAACRAVSEWRGWRGARTVPAQQAQNDTLDRELSGV